MTHEEKIQWMAMWCVRNGCMLELSGEVGFGRECVGIVRDGHYPSYEWYNEETWEREDQNGHVWTPSGAYHKHPCVAVLGRGEEAEAQLYEWLQWFDANGFKLETVTQTYKPNAHPIELLLGGLTDSRMVKQAA